jgi:FkbM family methyltransferase
MNNAHSFLRAYLEEARVTYGNNYNDNYDETRFGPAPSRPVSSLIKEYTRQCLLEIGLGKVTSVIEHMEKAFRYAAPSLPRLEKLYHQLADEESKSLLVKVIAYRALGDRKVKLPFNTPALWQGIAQLEALASKTDTMTAPSATPSIPWMLRRIDLTSQGIPITLYTIPVGVCTMFDIQQYRCQCLPKPIEAAPGDYVLDGGGCWGDTALYFADKVGERGKIFSFEFVPENLRILQKNLEINPSLRDRIEIVKNALWSKSGETLSYNQQGPGTKVLPGDDDAAPTTVETLAIDDLIARKNLSKLDFIKMDIEGSELAALRGAEQTLKRFTPKLAICVYHKLADFFDIPDYLDSLNVGYRFYLRHFTIHSEETILFAAKD